MDAREARLHEQAQQLGVVLDDRQIGLLLRFAGLLKDWSAVHNLSAIRAEDGILTGHVLDSLAAVAPLARWAAGRSLRVLDVGSGAGLPGVVLAVARPDWSITTVDAVAKKAAFVRQVAGELGLDNLMPLHARVEALPPDARFDVVISRAFAGLGDFVAATRGRLAPRGVWLAMKGLRPDREMASLPATVKVFHVEPIRVPGLQAARCLVWIRPN